MKDNRNEWFDHLQEEDILRNLPEDLPEMEDELAAKRIENKVLEELRIDMGVQKKQRRKHLLAAAVCCIAFIGFVGREPIMAAFERVFYDLPGVGVYIDDEDKKIYEVWIDDPVQEKDGVRVELMDFYCEGAQIYGTVRITGEQLLATEYDENGEEVYDRDALKAKFPTTWYYGEKEKKFHASGGATTWGDGYVTRYDQRGDEWLYLEDKGIDTYYLEVGGFDRRFTLKIVEPKKVETADEIGYSQTLNDTTITARAAVVNDKVKLEYYILPSDEVKLYFEEPRRRYVGMMPYQFDMERYPKVFTASGEQQNIRKPVSKKSGISGTVDATEKDFPLTFYYPTLTGTNMEEHKVHLNLPKDGETVTEDLPKVNFKYGTLEILSIHRRNGEESNGATGNPKMFPKTYVELMYRVTPKDGVRQMYDVCIDVENEEYSGYGGMDTGEDYYVNGWEISLDGHEIDEMTLVFKYPLYWIKGDYNIVIEKPTELLDRSSAIDVESEEKPRASITFYD